MRKTILTAALAVLMLLAGCAPAGSLPAGPGSAGSETMETAAPATGESAAGEPARQQALWVVLDGCIAYEIDAAGGSLKTARAAAALVVYLAGDGVPADLYGATKSWQQGLDGDQQATLDANWPQVCRCARDICGDPAAQQGLLDDAGVTEDFGAMDLEDVPAQLDTMDEAIQNQ